MWIHMNSKLFQIFVWIRIKYLENPLLIYPVVLIQHFQKQFDLSFSVYVILLFHPPQLDHRFALSALSPGLPKNNVKNMVTFGSIAGKYSKIISGLHKHFSFVFTNQQKLFSCAPKETRIPKCSQMKLHSTICWFHSSCRILGEME